MKKIIVHVARVSLIAALWVTCFGYGARDLVSSCGGHLDYKLLASPAKLIGPRIARNDSILSTTVADATTPAVMAQPDVNGSQVSLKGVGRFDHLLADTSSEEAMAPQKSDSADTGASRTR
jgi:hypothetical protein